jgi:hypothetical protein
MHADALTFSMMAQLRIEICHWYCAWADVMDNVMYVMKNSALRERLTHCEVQEQLFKSGVA